MQLLNIYMYIYCKFEQRENHRSCKKARRLTELTVLGYCTKVKVLGTVWSEKLVWTLTVEKAALHSSAEKRPGHSELVLCTGSSKVSKQQTKGDMFWKLKLSVRPHQIEKCLFHNTPHLGARAVGRHPAAAVEHHHSPPCYCTCTVTNRATDTGNWICTRFHCVHSQYTVLRLV